MVLPRRIKNVSPLYSVAVFPVSSVKFTSPVTHLVGNYHWILDGEGYTFNNNTSFIKGIDGRSHWWSTIDAKIGSSQWILN